MKGGLFMWKITLADGTFLDGLTLNGNNFVSKTEITPDVFAGKLGHVVIECDNAEDKSGLAGTWKHMRLAALRKYSDGWYFVLDVIPAEELEMIKLKANIEYLAMMTEVDL